MLPQIVLETPNQPYISFLYLGPSEYIARIANAVPVTLYSMFTANVEIVVLNIQKCNQCLKVHKSIGLFFEGVLQLSLSSSFSLYLLLLLAFCWSGHVSSSLSSHISRVTSLSECCMMVQQSVSQLVSDKVTYRAVWGQLKTRLRSILRLRLRYSFFCALLPLHMCNVLDNII